MRNPDVQSERNPDVQSDRLSLLMTYTTFHLGVYIALSGGATALVKSTEVALWLFPSVVAFIIAGMAGGTIGVNISRFDTYQEFKHAKIGFSKQRLKFWENLEHISFWIGLFWGLIVIYWKI